MRPVPQFVPIERLCGRRYHEADWEAGVNATCACGTFAIGQCAECETLVCGDHSRLVGGSRLCRSCEAKRIENRRADNARMVEQQDAARRKSEAERATRNAELVAEFLQAMADVPKLDIIEEWGPLVEIKVRRYEDRLVHRDSRVVDRGWCVLTPKAQRVPRFSSSAGAGADPIDLSFVPSLAVGEGGKVYVVDLGDHYRPFLLLANETEKRTLPQDLGVLLDTAKEQPWRPNPPLTKKEARRRKKQLDEEMHRAWEERTYGPGGRAGYHDRMYGTR